MLKRYIKIWWKLSLASSQIALQSRFGAILFLIGKLVRFTVFLFFIVVLISKTNTLAGYSLWQVMLFYATFNLLDTLPQFFFRNVYRFRTEVVNGTFDTVLMKPMPALFHPLLGGSDILDGILIVLSIGMVIFATMQLDGITVMHILGYIVLVANGFLIALAFHIFVLGIGILTTAVDNTIMLYRDLTQMGRWPIEIYQEPLRGLLTFVIPIGIMMSFPVKAMLGLLSYQLLLGSLVMGILLVVSSLFFWQYSLKHYSSASS